MGHQRWIWGNSHFCQGLGIQLLLWNLNSWTSQLFCWATTINQVQPWSYNLNLPTAWARRCSFLYFKMSKWRLREVNYFRDVTQPLTQALSSFQYILMSVWPFHEDPRVPSNQEGPSGSHGSFWIRSWYQGSAGALKLGNRMWVSNGGNWRDSLDNSDGSYSVEEGKRSCR